MALNLPIMQKKKTSADINTEIDQLKYELRKKEGQLKTDKQLVKIAEEIYNELKKEFHVVYDEGGSVGRRYSRNDEIGTPYCITLDDKTPKQKDVTIRNRDDKKQIRVKIADLKETLRKLINDEIEFEKAGKII